MAEPTLRESLEANFKDPGDAPDPVEPALDPAAGDAGESPADTSAADGVGKPGVADIPGDNADAAKSYLDPNKPPPPVIAPSAAAQDIKAPLSWKPELRDSFKTLAEPIRNEILRREADVARFVQETAGYRKYIQDFEQVCAPFQHVISLEGGDPLKAFGDYLRTASLLRMGTPLEKAQAVANAVKTFAVDVQTLDQALAAVFGGQPLAPQPGNGANGAQPQFQDPRVDQLITALQQSQTQRTQEQEERQLTEIQAFRADPKNEFFEDLRKDIADLLEFNANRGVKMSLQQAYDMTAQMHPEIGKLWAQKKAQAQAADNAKLIAQKRKAMVGVPGTPDLSRQQQAPETLRDSIAQAIDQHSQQV